MTDLEFILYVLLTLVQLYGAVLFVWWWWKNNWSATPMYLCLTVLFIAAGLHSVTDGVAYYDRVLDGDSSMWVFDHTMWKYRIVPLLLVYSVIVGHMTFRVLVRSGRLSPVTKIVDSWFSKLNFLQAKKEGKKEGGIDNDNSAY